MRVLLVAALSAVLIGCSGPSTRRATLETCQGCFYKTAVGSQNEPKPTPSKRYRTKVASKDEITRSSVAKKEAKPAAPPSSDGSDKDTITTNPESSATSMSPRPTENAKNTVGTNTNVTSLGQTPEPSDPVMKKAKATVASKMEDPASVEFEDMTRALRKDTFGQSIDTICGHVRGKKPSGEETGTRGFLYLVQEDIAFVDYGYRGSVTTNAYRNVCTSNN